jgi:hypothetical protein
VIVVDALASVLHLILQLIPAMGVRPLPLECHGQVIIENYEVGWIVKRIKQKV